VFWLDWLAGVFLLLAAPLIPLFMALVGMGAEKLNQQHFHTISRLSGQFLDRIRALTTLQLFAADRRAADLLQERSDAYRRITMKTLRLAFLSSAVLEFFSSVAIAVIAIYIGFGLLGYIHFGPA
ncbi:MAG TPA: thiol reductant ABC exporter subunit CydD, partial [Marinobacter sp.]|nr:thiol reductant ABC exporter subunit CydD [Marinobacter sp.]